MTKTQTEALAKIKAAGTLYAYNGVSYATAKALHNMGLIKLTVFITRSYNSRNVLKPSRDWTAEIV